MVLINQVAEHIIGAGGKRLRPMLLLLAAGALGHRGPDAHQLAAVVEFIHTATLLHDDVVDESDLRRGRSTANAVWGNAASVLVGDFLYSRSFQLMVELDRMEVMQILADTTNRIAEGEVLQLLHVRNPDTDEAAYLRVIERKTAVLFAAATRLGALLAGADATTCDALHDYGMNLGYAFQIADDVLDYASDAQTLGKNLGDDLAEGKATLPLIHAIAHADAATRGPAARGHRAGRCRRVARSAGGHPRQRRAGVQPRTRRCVCAGGTTRRWPGLDDNDACGGAARTGATTRSGATTERDWRWLLWIAIAAEAAPAGHDARRASLRQCGRRHSAVPNRSPKKPRSIRYARPAARSS